MVLFKNDIARDKVYIDTATQNLSFIKMAIQLNKMGIRNNTFFLSLYDKDLIGVDPHNLQDESLELRGRIAQECKINYWYFIREVVRVVSSGSEGIRFILNRANLAQAWLFLNSINGFLTMPRQIGKTIGGVSILDWYIYLAAKKLSVGMFCQGSMLQWDNVKRLKEIRDALPKYLISPSVADSNNKEGVTYAELGTQLQTFIAQMDKQAADRLGRGNSLAVEMWDEIAYFVNNDLSWSSATAAMNSAAPAARETGLPAAIIITTTAGDMDDKWGNFAYKMVCDALRFTEALYDVEDRAHLMDILRTNSKNNIVYMEYDHKQLGKSDEWFEEVTRGKDPKVIEKDYRNKWIHGSDNSLFDKAMLDRITGSGKEPVTTTWMESLVINWYVHPDEIMKNAELRNRPYIIGCDTSDNVGRDFTSVIMLDPYSLKPVAVIRANCTNFMFIARCIVKLLIDFPRSIIIPERNKNGAVLVDYIILEIRKRGLNPLKKIFNKYFQEYNPDIKLDNLNYDSGLVRKNFGFNTTSSSTSRDFLYSRVMMVALKLVADKLCDMHLIKELCGLTVKNNRVDHTNGGHDDLVISFLLACYFLLFAANHRFYGIELDEVLCNIKADGEECSQDEKMRIMQMQRQIEEFKSRIKHCQNDIVKNVYKRELQNLIAMVGDTDENYLNEDNVQSMSQIAKEAVTAPPAKGRFDIADRMLSGFF